MAESLGLIGTVGMLKANIRNPSLSGTAPIPVEPGVAPRL